MSDELNMEAERAEFEAWLRNRWPNAARPIDEKTATGSYAFTENNLLWEAWQAAHRTASVSAPMGTNGEAIPLPPIERDEGIDRTYIPLPGGWEIQTKGKGSTFRIAHVPGRTRWMVLSDDLHEPLEAMARDTRNLIEQQADRIRHLERELELSKQAFIGSENARKDAERARGTVQSIGDDSTLEDLAGDVYRAGSYNESIEKPLRALIAYIDGRTAGTASAIVAEAPRSREWQPVTGPGQVRKGDKLRFKIGDKAYSERAKLILHPGTDKEEVIYDKGRNYYFITAMVMSGFSNHKCVEVLAAAPAPLNGKEEANGNGN